MQFGSQTFKIEGRDGKDGTAAWREHRYGSINLEAFCPSTPGRYVILQMTERKVTFPFPSHTHRCPCCRAFIESSGVYKVYVNNCVWGYKATTRASVGTGRSSQHVKSARGEAASFQGNLCIMQSVDEFEEVCDRCEGCCIYSFSLYCFFMYSYLVILFISYLFVIVFVSFVFSSPDCVCRRS
jgi:hypothetical protein